MGNSYLLDAFEFGSLVYSYLRLVNNQHVKLILMKLSASVQEGLMNVQKVPASTYLPSFPIHLHSQHIAGVRNIQQNYITLYHILSY